MYLESVISWNDMVLMVEQQFLTHMSNWMTDRPLGVYFQAVSWVIFSLLYFIFFKSSHVTC